MSSEHRLKATLLDTTAFAYTIAVFTYAFVSQLHQLGLVSLGYDRDYFINHFSQLVWLALFLLPISALIGALFRAKGFITLGALLFGTQPHDSTKPVYQTFAGLHLILIFAISLSISIFMTEASLKELMDPEGLRGAARLWLGLASPNWDILPRAVIEAIETIYIAFLATVLAVPIAFFLAFFAAKNLMRSQSAFGIYAALRLVINLSRSIEPLVWALIFTVWVGVGPFAGMLALFLHSIASLIKYYSEVLEGISEGPLDAIRSTGANDIQVVWFGAVPQIILPYIAMTLYRWDTNVRMATVIGLVGGGGIGTLLITYQGQGMWPEVGCIVLVIAVIVWLMDTASALIREALK